MTANHSLLVRKRPLLDEHPVPVVECEVMTDASEPVRFRLVESLPCDTGDLNLGFYGAADAWSVRSPDTVIFEGIVQQGAPCRGAYAVATTECQFRRAFMDCPVVEVATDDRGSLDWVRRDDVDFYTVEPIGATV